MIDENEVLTVIRKKVRRGAYGEVAHYLKSLPLAIQTAPLIALECSRAFLHQGRLIDAEITLATASPDRVTPGEQLILAMENASLKIFRRIAIREALEAVKTAFATAGKFPINQVDYAEAERVHIRIILTAATYYEIPPDEGRTARDRLLVIAETLAKAQHLDESLAARFNYAQRLDDLNQRAEALANLADYAVTVDRPALAGEAQVVRAEQLLAAGAASDEIRAVLDSAALLYTQIDHVHGLIEVQLVRAKIAVEREFATPEALEACLAAYQQIDFPKGILNVLIYLSQLAHDRGNTRTAETYRQQIIRLAETLGMGLAKHSCQTAQIDLLMRNNDYGKAIEQCQAVLASNLPLFSKAGYEQLLATAYFFIKNLDKACFYGRRAKEGFEAIGAIDSASNSVETLASNLLSFRQDERWQEAEELLKQWVGKDEKRGDLQAAINKRDIIAQIKIERFLYSPIQSGQVGLLDEAEQEIRAAEALTTYLCSRDAAKRRGSLYQLHGQLYEARGDENGVIQTWRNALAVYDQAGLSMHVANCRHILGMVYLNRANQDLMANFGEAEANFHEALTYYDSVAMREQAANTRFMFARLYTNASIQVTQDIGNQMLDAAIGHLADGESDYDAVRREFTAGDSVLEIQRGKRVLIEKSQRIYELALEILCLLRPDPVAAWNWVQRAKARALSDVLGIGSIPPTRIMAELQQHPASFSLLLEEREIADQIKKVTPEERIGLRETLDDLWERMKRDPNLSEYLELRTGTALEADALTSLITSDVGIEYSSVCIDWIAVGERLFLLALRSGQSPKLFSLSLRLSAVRSFIKTYLAPDVFRLTLRDTPEVLRELDPLISPLIDISAPEDILILSPTGLLHALPLHALEIKGIPILVRNPIVYCPSLSVLRHCFVRRRKCKEKQRTAALFGDPSGDRSEAAKLVLYLEQLFKTKPFIKEAVTRQAFTKAISGCSFIHFQGHAVQKPNEPLDSYLVLADYNLAAREIFDLPNLQAELVTLAACESAVNVIETGDEPLGLIPAFLYAGTNSVLATLWKVNQTSTAKTMRLFYDKLTESERTITKVQALRQAMLTIRNTPGFDSPYYWAPFVLYGDWL